MKEKSKDSLDAENVQLRKENKALKDTVAVLLKEVDRLRDSVVTDLFVEDSEISLEEQIILKQIKFLMAESLLRTLTLDETRALDLLLKNKRLIDEKKPKKNEDEVPEGTTDADLLRIVSDDKEVKPKKQRKRSKSKTGD